MSNILWRVMEDSSNKRGLVYKHRKLIACIVIMFISFQLINIIPQLIIQLNPEPDPVYELSHSLTVWILPAEEEFYLHIDFYNSEQNAADRVNRLIGLIISVQPLDDEQHDVALINLPENLLTVWAKIYFDEEPFLILRIDLGQKITTILLGREISILMELLHVEDG